MVEGRPESNASFGGDNYRLTTLSNIALVISYRNISLLPLRFLFSSGDWPPTFQAGKLCSPADPLPHVNKSSPRRVSPWQLQIALWGCLPITHYVPPVSWLYHSSASAWVWGGGGGGTHEIFGRGWATKTLEHLTFTNPSNQGGGGGQTECIMGNSKNYREWYPILDKNPLNFFISYRFKILSFTVVHMWQ